MSNFKLDDDIPLPEPAEDLEEEEADYIDSLRAPDEDDEDDEDPEVPGKRGRKPRCRRNEDHVWHDIGNGEEKCITCFDIFPCRNVEKCWHRDCWEARGKRYRENLEGDTPDVPLADSNSC